ncbi:MazG-like family protein [Rodentibacter pneumotropicus]|uniref:Pyrophosphatase n=1 Tax=Rodentibacter pneumotropicus TaxID=758 RepID=A0A4S2PY43_9PAST|nr:MazG-like family protein [Rodentibacter pneumotropicus]THA08983.1 pyrophosphatase [Rodentibacter pneumotropicus]
MNQLIKNIEQWAEERNLIEGSTPQKQFIKLMEEFGELCSGVSKNKVDVVKDSIGDCFVVSIILCKQLGLSNCIDFYNSDVIDEYRDGKYEDTSTTEQLLEAVHNLGAISIPINQGWKFQKEWLELFFINLVIISLFNNLSFKDCVQHSYDQIKDRKGKIIDGVFVKQSDLQDNKNE